MSNTLRQTLPVLIRRTTPHRSITTLRPFFADDFFGRPVLARDPFADMMALRRAEAPGYEIHEDDNKFQLSIDLPGVKAEDMSVNLEHNGRLLHLSGGRKVQKENSISETRFDQRFTLAENVDTTQLSANLANGVLVVTAPNKEEEDATTTIQITEGPHAEPEQLEAESAEEAATATAEEAEPTMEAETTDAPELEIEVEAVEESEMEEAAPKAA